MNPDVRGLADKSRRHLTQARRFLKEGAEDFAISHGYYAMFHMAEAALRTRGLRFKSHEAVIGTFAREFIKTGRIPTELGRALRDAREERVDAEYGMGEAVEPGVAERVVANAELFVATVEAELNRGS